MGEKELLNIVKIRGFRYISKPKTVFVPHSIEESDLDDEIVILRNEFGYMVQTEIT